MSHPIPDNANGQTASEYPHRVLVLFAHPAVQKSRVNRELLAAIKGVPGIDIVDLYEEYPDHHINVRREQQRLLDHDIIIWQHPFYWYSSPAILKEWQDLVLEYGFAYGEHGTHLRGKRLMSAITTGGPPESYRAGALNNYSVREFLRPFEQTVRLCHMEYLPPFVVQGTLNRIDQDQIRSVAAVYRETLLALRDGRVDWEMLRRQEFINVNEAAAGQGRAS